MRFRDASFWIWPALGMLIAVFAAWWIRAPGYMDADYYFANAQQIVRAGRLEEPFLWNYLDDPPGLPHPAFLYWMPLASFVSAAFMSIAGASFRAAQAGYVLAAAAIPAMTAAIARRLSADKTAVRQAAALAIVPGFLLPFFVTTDSFSIYLLVGAGALWAMASAAQSGRWPAWMGAGLLVGLAHLTRADGVLLLGPGLLAAWIGARRRTAIPLLLAGYLAVMIPWWVRNWSAVGSPFPVGLNRTLWLVRYDDLFSFPASILTPARWWGSGLSAILTGRFHSLIANVQTLVAVNGLIFLGPFIVLGALEKRSELLVRLNGVYLLLLLGVMSFVFPFAGSRGGFFHSSTALMPVFWSLAPLGIERAVGWAAERRGWAIHRARALFGWSAPILAALLTLGLFWTRVIGPSSADPAWGRSSAAYAQVDTMLEDLDPSHSPVASNNPPGFFLATGAPGVMIPNGPPETLHLVVEQYDVGWVILDANRPDDLADLYRDPESAPWLRLAGRITGLSGGDILILRVTRGLE